jgi:hypothetical protein
MRIANLLVVFLLSLILVGTALASDQPGQASLAGSAETNSLYPPLNEIIPELFSGPRDSGYDLIHPDEVHPNFNDPELVHPYHYRLPRMNRDESTVCYTMRSYLMAREARDSDVTSPAGYSTCQKASRFAVKDAVEPLEPASR